MDTAGFFDGAEGLLILLQVAVEGHGEALGMIGRHDDALTHRGAFATGEGLGKIEDEFGRRVGDDGQVAVGALRDLVVNAKIQIIGVVFVLCRKKCGFGC